MPQKVGTGQITLVDVNDGPPGPQGNSMRRAYSKSALASLAGAPATITTAGDTSFPANGSWGAGTVWGGAPVDLAAGEKLFRIDGEYSVATNQTVWTLPYEAALKVGSLSAVSTDTGDLTVSGLMKSANYVPGEAGFAVKQDGTAEFGDVLVRGEVVDSTFKNGAMALNSARFLTTLTAGYEQLAPLSIYDLGQQVSSAVINGSVTLSGFKGPDAGPAGAPTYNAKRFARLKTDVILKAAVHGDLGNETLYLEVSYNGGGWTTIVNPTVDLNYRGGMTISVRYTTLATWWSDVAFRARTTQGRTTLLCFEVQVFNFNESGNTAGSNSGISSAASGGSGGTLPPDEPWCVDAETTVLASGTFVRDLLINDRVEVWNDDPINPKVELAQVQRVRFGYEQSYLLRTESGAAIIQSRSTPMTLRDGRVATTDAMLGEDVLVKRGGSMTWERVVAIEDRGIRRVVKVSLGDRMYFAGADAVATIATHNAQMKPT